MGASAAGAVHVATALAVLFIYICAKVACCRQSQPCWKIGCTGAGVGISKRLQQWAKSCGHAPELMVNGESRGTDFARTSFTPS
ncbi:uncharacterized protein EV422DRAFT_516148 [Fimicolochytrium jonesii]|uniref:uncharacterized protein n=1 Tax=Fimicolochytrium jonesii TaxID=1396493 RepID=UPI0022FE4621|nr:uncharacterized protein EV422DRAFT_516148 [Fimicolochytrium jonesii]KAI8826302.1 hypothetical protein EV422DRAFT_516148 [Fimicolochytrium jonesii]